MNNFSLFLLLSAQHLEQGLHPFLVALALVVDLFQVPEGYQMTVMPAGGLLEMMTGKSCEENTQKVDETRDAIQKSNEQIKEQLKEVNDKSKSDEERMKALLEMLGGQKKK